MPKTNYKDLEKKLTMQKRNAWEVWDEKTKQSAFKFSEGYKKFLNKSKTEREAVSSSIELARQSGFKDMAAVKSLKAGDKVYAVNRDKNLFLAKIGKKPLGRGFNMVMPHIDSPHLDLKVVPLYEDESLAFLKTHYYGGIKKYQWPTIALALHGQVYLENGKKVEINIGEKDSDPIFMITDLLPHIDRHGAPGAKVELRDVQGEDLNLVVGSIPVKDEKVKEKVKLAILEYLWNEYGMKEIDLASAELHAVPCEKARDLGFDRSLISAFGQDDLICAYAALMSIIESKVGEKTQILAMVDREEIGSAGNTGANSYYLETFVSDLSELVDGEDDLDHVYKIFAKSQAISADVTAGLDPDYKDAFDVRNACRLGFGLAIEKYTGHGGKYSTSEASGKFLRGLITLYNKNKDIIYQLAGGMGKIDKGGGGTIAKYLANRNMEVIDAGVPLFNMHAPLEISSKADLYCAYLAYKTFIEN
ncbi:MAG: aminopeptidase [Patescibacteria group bacterium]|nr:aminopeptidase [Patescibacteria group bacterium]